MLSTGSGKAKDQYNNMGEDKGKAKNGHYHEGKGECEAKGGNVNDGDGEAEARYKGKGSRWYKRFLRDEARFRWQRLTRRLLARTKRAAVLGGPSALPEVLCPLRETGRDQQRRCAAAESATD